MPIAWKCFGLSCWILCGRTFLQYEILRLKIFGCLAKIKSDPQSVYVINYFLSFFQKGALERKAYRDKQGGPRFTVKEPDTEEEIIEEEPTKTNEDFFNVCNEKKIEKPKKKSRSKSRDKKPKNQKPKSQIAWKRYQLLLIFIFLVSNYTDLYPLIIYIFLKSIEIQKISRWLCLWWENRWKDKTKVKCLVQWNIMVHQQRAWWMSFLR